MTPAQRSMCFGEWKKCWKAIVIASGGATTAPEDGVRAGVTFKAIGVRKSWGALWNQTEVDRLLAIMWAISNCEDLEAQLRQLDQPATRLELDGYAQALLAAIGIEPAGRLAYANGVALRIYKRGLDAIKDTEWPAILVALNHTRQHKAGEGHNHPFSGKGRSRFAHRVGQRRAGQKSASTEAASHPRANVVEMPAQSATDGDAPPF